MTSGSKPFGHNIYLFSELAVGETKTFSVGDAAEAKRIRKAAHNLNARSDRYFTTRCKDAVMYVTRIR